MSGKVITPGPSLVEAANAMTSKRRLAGAWPYQWMFPGPHSKDVDVPGNVVLPDAPGQATVLTYTVPEGLRFTLRGIVFQYSGDNWVQGSGSILWTLTVASGGTRNVEGFVDVATQRGSVINPFPILGRLEFQSLDFLSITVSNVSLAVTPASSPVSAQLLGWTYPNSEAA